MGRRWHWHWVNKLHQFALALSEWFMIECQWLNTWSWTEVVVVALNFECCGYYSYCCTATASLLFQFSLKFLSKYSMSISERFTCEYVHELFLSMMHCMSDWSAHWSDPTLRQEGKLFDNRTFGVSVSCSDSTPLKCGQVTQLHNPHRNWVIFVSIATLPLLLPQQHVSCI